MAIAPARDNTDSLRFGEFNVQDPFWQAVDIENGWIFAAIHKGVQIWDGRNNPADPKLEGLLNLQGFSGSKVPVYLAPPEDKDPVFDVDAPAGRDDIAAITMDSNTGLIIANLSNKSNPGVYYQDHGAGKSAFQTWATTLGGKAYAFVAYSGAGVRVYDMDAAVLASAALGGSPCAEETPNSIKCSGVFVGRVGNSSYVNFVSGVGSYLATSGNLSAPTKVEIWNVANPRNVQALSSPILTIEPKSSSGKALRAHGTAMWQAGGKTYLAVRGGSEAHIYDVSCLSSGGCGSLQPIWRTSTPSDVNQYVTFSMSGATPFLYFGNDTQCSSSVQNEFLYDVSNPANPRDITPPAQMVPDPYTGSPTLTGYWGWYYRLNRTGFNWIMPREGKFNGEYFYRAANGLFDVHRRTGGVAPVANFSWSPSEIYPGTPVDFADLSTGGAESWLWTFPGGTPGSSVAKNPQDVTFATQGDKTVGLEASNSAGSDTQVKTVKVLDPAPAVSGITKSPTAPIVCQHVTLTATGVTGKPPLSYSWQVSDGSGYSVPGSGNPFVWDTSSAVANSTYTATVRVNNATGPEAVANVPVELDPLPPLQFNSGITISPDPPFSGTVTFQANAQGASSWLWDFGDDRCPAGFTVQNGKCFTQDPLLGPAPTHSYLETGTYDVSVEVDNCKEQPISQSRQVIITSIVQLHAEFSINCFTSGGVCFATTGQVLAFADSSTGADGWDYDWDGNGSWEDPGHTTPVTTHAYPTAGSFQPKVRVSRGPDQDVYTLPETISVTGGTNPPRISVTGPSSGSVGQALGFSATASNCSPSSSWTWSASGGGSVNGSSSTASVSWASTGTKTVTVTNSGCVGATGSKVVSISDGSDPGGGAPLEAKISFSPNPVQAGVAATFDASESTGSPTNYSWDFGDGGTASGKTVTHIFTKAGSYRVTLNIGKAGTGPGCFAGICGDDEFSTVQVVGDVGVAASFATDSSCFTSGASAICEAATGEPVTFTDTSVGKVTSRSWTFGDGTTAKGAQVEHVFARPGTFAVTLEVTDGKETDTASKIFVVEGEADVSVSPVVVPWIAQADADKALHQTSDLDVHNPGDEPIKVRMTFRKRGLPEPDPPQVERTIQPGATLHVPDAMNVLFNRANASGYLFVEPIEGASQPVATTFNRTFAEGGASYGQVVPGFPLRNLRQAAEGPKVHHLVGLNDNGERHAYFGISNPNEEALQYHLRFYDALGRLVASTDELHGIAAFGQKQYQVEVIRRAFGVENVEDYRIEVEVAEGSPEPFVYGANLRLVSKDPSFLRVGRTDLEEVFLVGALNTPGLNDSYFQSDLVLGNTGTSEAVCDVTYTPVGYREEPTPAFTETVPAGQSVRLVNVVAEWNVGDSVGVLRIACDGADGVFPVVQGEGYDVSRPSQVYGQFMPALSADQAAEPGKAHSLVGLLQDAENRTTVWLYNPTDEVTRYDLRYLDLDGNELGGESNVVLGRGKLRQLNPGHHPAGIDGGFVVRIEPTSGKLLTAAQVVNAANDPAYIVGQ